MKKKTVDDKFEHWYRKKYRITPSFLWPSYNAYRAGWRAKTRGVRKQLKEKDKQIQGLKDTIIQLVEACEGYARDAAQMEAEHNAFQKVEWEKTDWKFIDIGHTVKFVYGDASNVWRQK